MIGLPAVRFREIGVGGKGERSDYLGEQRLYRRDLALKARLSFGHSVGLRSHLERCCYAAGDCLPYDRRSAFGYAAPRAAKPLGSPTHVIIDKKYRCTRGSVVSSG
jgi:hypothetical protein